MTSYLIPMSVEASSHFTQTVSLSGTVFSFRFLWNERDGRFYMDVSTTDGERNGIRMVPNSPLLGNSPVTTDGDFYLLSRDSNADENNIEYSQYGTMWNLYWVPFDQEDEEED